MRRFSTPSAALASLALCATAFSDDLHLTDGSTIAGVDVTGETMTEVSYKDDKKTKTVEADKVLSISYTEMPVALSRGNLSIQDDFLLDAEADFLNYIEGVRDRPSRKEVWARAYAYHQLAVTYAIMGNVDSFVDTANEMTEIEGESRYLPIVLRRKAQLLFDFGDAEAAVAAIGELEELADDKGLGRRWELEVALGKAVYGSTGSAQRKKLESVSGDAGNSFPVVRNAAEVAIGASYLEEGNLSEAEKVFESVVEDPKADDRTLAAAYTGMGQCLFRRAEGAQDADLFKRARASYMRVVVLYKTETAFLPEALFFAGRCFQEIGGDTAQESANKLYSRVIKKFPDSKWANEAKGFRKKTG